MKRQRIYIDTSIVGGCLDEEFERESLRVFDLARDGTVALLVADLLLAELRRSPNRVQEVLEALPTSCVEYVSSSAETETLRDGYLDSGVVGVGSANDAHHVAIASVHRADMIVIWNFRHIVHYDKIRRFNAVNLREGYGTLEIYSPREVV